MIEATVEILANSAAWSVKDAHYPSTEYETSRITEFNMNALNFGVWLSPRLISDLSLHSGELCLLSNNDECRIYTVYETIFKNEPEILFGPVKREFEANVGKKGQHVIWLHSLERFWGNVIIAKLPRDMLIENLFYLDLQFQNIQIETVRIIKSLFPSTECNNYLPLTLTNNVIVLASQLMGKILYNNQQLNIPLMNGQVIPVLISFQQLLQFARFTESTVISIL